MLGNKTLQHLRIFVISSILVAIETMAFMYESFHVHIKLHWCGEKKHNISQSAA